MPITAFNMDRPRASAAARRRRRGQVLRRARPLLRLFAPPASAAASIGAEDETAMRILAARGAEALGLEVFGGDFVREQTGVMVD